MELSALYRDIVERSPDAIWVCDLHARTIYANQAMCELYGGDEHDLETLTVFDTLDDLGKHQFAAHLDDLKHNGVNVQDVDVLFWRKDGTSLWVIISEVLLHDDDGNIIGFTQRISDYSGRRRALDELQRSRAELSEAHRLARLGSWHWDVLTDEIHASTELCEIFGWRPESFPAPYAEFLDAIHQDDRDQASRTIDAALKQPGEFTFLARLAGSSGWVWTRVRGVSIADASGRVVSMSGTDQDVSESKLADLAFEDQVRQNALMQMIAVAANEARTLNEVLVHGRDLALLHDDWRRARGFVPDEAGTGLVPLYITELEVSEDAETPEESEMELELANRVFRAGKAIWADSMLTIGFPVSDGERVVAVVTLTSEPPLFRFEFIQTMVEQVAVQLGRVAERERTERVLADARDAAMEASRQKSEFLATMSHEIRTPLNGVIGLNDLLMRTALDGDQLRLASGVQVASRALLGIINDVLDFSKIEAGKLELERLDFEIRTVFDQVASMLGESARAKGLELIVSCHPDVPDVLRGDPTRLAQVLTNLGSNAVKFTETGEVFIRATASPRADGGTQLHVSVTDTGIGVPEGDVDHLFEAFTQADASTTRRYGGTGLGLAISREIVEALGGEIGLGANPGGGSVFWFTAQLETPSGSHIDPDDEVGRKWLTDRRVLVVDDNDHNRLILEEQLGRWGIKAATAPDADAAEAAIREARADGTPFEAVLLDMAMPGRDGLDLARTLQADPANVGLRRVLLTSSGAITPGQLAGTGISTWLTKPALAAELRAALLAELADPEARPTPVAPAAADPAHARHVLVVEDNPVNQLVAVGLLEALGYVATTADDGVAALEMLEHGRFDAVLMDVQMPRLDGYAATRAIRAAETDTHLPVIAMTATAVEGERERCLAAGMDDFLTKPVDPRALVTALDRWVGEGTTRAVRRTLPTVPVNGDSPDPLADLALERLDELRDLDPGNTTYLDRAIGNFVQNTPETLDAIRRAVAERDAAQLKHLAHKLAGGALNLGVNTAGHTAQQIELIADGGTTEGTEELVEQLEGDLTDGRAALLAYQARYSSGPAAG